jgi:putative oxidoreductase
MKHLIWLAARLLLGQLFVIAGLAKLGAGYAATQSYMQTMGVPRSLLPLVIVLEIGGGLALMAGFITRWAALALALYSLLAALIFHHNFGNQTQMILFMSDIAVAGGLLLLYVHGAGALSVDRLYLRGKDTVGRDPFAGTHTQR